VQIRRLPACCVLLGILALGGCATIPAPITLTAPQSSAIDQAQAYLNGLTSFQAHFVQSGWSGPGSGTVWVDRPGRLRLSYAGPAAKDMVANNGLLIITDRANSAVTTMPVAKTPLGLLLAPHIALSGAVAVTGYAETSDTLSITLQDATHPAQGTLSVTLRKSPLSIASVTATDIHGRALTLSLSDLIVHPLITPALFAAPGPGS
jgi:outer membrane lipoprotein-sorting protein